MKEVFLNKYVVYMLTIFIAILFMIFYNYFSKYICEKKNGTFVSGSQGNMCIYEKENK